MTNGLTATEFRLRDLAFAAYAPTVVSTIGHGAVMPVLALRARELGADVGTAALVVALLGIGMLVSSLPAGALVARIGERRTLMIGGFVDAVAMIAAAATGSVLGLSVAVLVSGATWTAFLLARQAYMIDAVPPSHRARALSLLGASARVGVLIGPLLGAGLIHVYGLRAAFLLAAAMSAGSALIAMTVPDLGAANRAHDAANGRASVWSVLRAHRRTFLTLGIAVLILGAARSVRASLLPLWADHVGLAASTTSLIFAAAAAIDIAFFLPGGWLMDHRGRMVVAIPVVLSVAAGAFLMPLTSRALAVGAVAMLIAAGNGLGSGIVMTIGADTAPESGRSQFLGGWRLCGDLGNTGGPLLISAIVTAAPLAAACVAVGVLAVLGAAWTGYWTHDLDVRRAKAG
ncbi:MFS transporter [Nocardioides speluncae]|uniref:MFS transporter n=1 Tax=Nocardioides speluncae TaxID=2670337 RepID=UPI000D6950E4|nr:MFS transporter [Nocardioides speluncae]